MVIETKYDIGQEVWRSLNGYIVKCDIAAINTETNSDGKPTSIIYDCYVYEGTGYMAFGIAESELFPSREAAEEQKQ